MNYILDTDRLRLRELTPDDASFIIALLNTPGWLQYIGDRHVKTGEEALAYLQNGPMKSYKEHGFGLWLVETREEGTPIGMCGVLKRELLEQPDIGFAFLPAYNGKGYAFEAAHATVAHAKAVLGIPKLSAIVLPTNEASIRLLQKLGLTFVRTFAFTGSSEELLLYGN